MTSPADIISQLIRADLQSETFNAAAPDSFNAAEIRLHANESPTDFDQSGMALNYYPEKQPQKLLQGLAEHYQVSQENMLITRGSDEGIDLLIRLCCAPGKDLILVCPPTFVMYTISGRLHGAKIWEVPLLREQGYCLDMKKLLKDTLEHRPKIIFICSPNNPTGNDISRDDILTVCRSVPNGTLVVVDEAYIEFSHQKSFVDHLQEFPHLVVLRTFSKAQALAGLRAGVLLANEQLITWLRRIIPPYAVPRPTAHLWLKALEPERQALIKKQIEMVHRECDRVAKLLEKNPNVLKVWPSDANFLLIEFKDPKAAMAKISKQGILVRPMTHLPGLENAIRISMGTFEQNQILLEILSAN